jgi:hypothetical protein
MNGSRSLWAIFEQLLKKDHDHLRRFISGTRWRDARATTSRSCLIVNLILASWLSSIGRLHISTAAELRVWRDCGFRPSSVLAIAIETEFNRMTGLLLAWVSVRTTAFQLRHSGYSKLFGGSRRWLNSKANQQASH